MIYISPEGEYPRHIGDIQLEHRDFRDGDDLPEGWVAVAPAIPPTPGEDEIAYEGFPVEIDGVMTQNWQIREMLTSEIERRDAAKNAKAKLEAFGLTEEEIKAITSTIIR